MWPCRSILLSTGVRGRAVRCRSLQCDGSLAKQPTPFPRMGLVCRPGPFLLDDAFPAVRTEADDRVHVGQAAQIFLASRPGRPDALQAAPDRAASRARRTSARRLGSAHGDVARQLWGNGAESDHPRVGCRAADDRRHPLLDLLARCAPEGGQGERPRDVGATGPHRAADVPRLRPLAVELVMRLRRAVSRH